MLRLFAILLASRFSLCQAAPTSSGYVIHEQRADSADWKKLQPLDKDFILPVRIGLAQSNLEKGEDMLMAVSDPESPRYGQFYSQEELHEFFAPSSETLTAVKHWLSSESIKEQRITHSENLGWFAFDATVDEVEKLLHTRFHLFEHTVSGQRNVATDDYSIPTYLTGHIDYITPGVRLVSRKRPFGPIPPRPYEGVQLGTSLANCTNAITPHCIRALYDIPFAQLHKSPQPNNAMGIYEFGDHYLQTDLDSFFQEFAPWVPNGTTPNQDLIEASPPGPGSVVEGEADLDFQLAYPIVYPQNLTLFQTDDDYYNMNTGYGGGLFNTFLDAIDGSYCTYAAYGETGDDPNIDPTYPDPNPGGYNGTLLCGAFKPTPVISISYGYAESDLPAFYQKRQCNEFMKLGLQGVSVFVASGDTGVSSRIFDPGFCLGTEGEIFSPDYPASCPFITSVGATMIPVGGSVKDPEIAAEVPGLGFTGFYSGGGFSNIYSRPKYQASVVHNYLTTHTPAYKSYSGPAGLKASLNSSDPGLYNMAGRGYPDVSANGFNTTVIINGQLSLIGGTSASAPIFASVINRINEKRLAAGKSTLGFLNPALYKNPGILNDILSGSNPGCNTEGFNVTQGWDPVTGLGTPNFPKMLSTFMQF